MIKSKNNIFFMEPKSGVPAIIPASEAVYEYGEIGKVVG